MPHAYGTLQYLELFCNRCDAYHLILITIRFLCSPEINEMQTHDQKFIEIFPM